MASAAGMEVAAAAATAAEGPGGGTGAVPASDPCGSDDARLAVASGEAAQAAGGALCDPLLWHHRQQLMALNSVLAAQLAQDPLQYRRWAGAALALAARPSEAGADPQQASALCMRLMS